MNVRITPMTPRLNGFFPREFSLRPSPDARCWYSLRAISEIRMKAAAGCFGCLTLLFLTMLVAGIAIPMAMDPSSMDGPALMVYGYASLMQTVGGSCCCLSSLAFVIFLALGMRGGGGDVE